MIEKKWLILIYNTIIWLIFFIVYTSLMNGNNFHVPNKDKDYTIGNAAFFTVVVHGTVGFGDIYPTSIYSRAAVACHIALVLLGSLSIYLIPLDNLSTTISLLFNKKSVIKLE